MELGNIVEYIDRERILCAVVLEVKHQRLRLLTENNREVNLSASRLLHRDKSRLDISMGRSRMVDALKEMANTRKALIARYKAGYAEVLRALDGFPADQLTARPIPGKWTAAEIVHHLADSETQSATRLRKLLVEPHPVIQGYDQEAWAAKLRYQQRPIGPSLAAFSGQGWTSTIRPSAPAATPA